MQGWGKDGGGPRPTEDTGVSAHGGQGDEVICMNSA